MANSAEFQKWNKLEAMKRMGILDEIDRKVERELLNIKIEIRVDGKWVEVKEHMLVDDPDNFRIEWLKEMDASDA